MRSRQALEIGGVGLAAAAAFAVLPFLGEWETIPFHVIWVGLTLLYGVRVWPLGPTLLLLAGLSAVSGMGLMWFAVRGEVSWAEVTEVPLMGSMFLAMVWHARRRRAALVAVQRSAERERDFVRDASHQLRTPITVARGHAELIRDAHPAGTTRSDAEIVLDELDRLSAMSDGLLVLATAELPDFLHLSDVDLEWFVITTGRRWTRSAKRRWTIEAPVNGSMKVDQERMTSAVDALVENAVGHTRDDDAISVTAGSDGPWAVIEVADAGPGIHPDRLERVFERFASFDRVVEGRKRGSGLGLSIAKAIVERHGGSITVSSGPGEGTTFAIRVPGFRPVEKSAERSQR